LPWAFRGFVSGVCVNENLKGHERILFHPVETFCDESPLADNEQQARLQINRYYFEFSFRAFTNFRAHTDKGEFAPLLEKT
jgi:hypothetical protein